MEYCNIKGMELKFYKLQIGGNDLLLVNQLKGNTVNEEILPQLARNMCRRSRGVGANGVIFLFKGVEHGVFLKYYNSRGSSKKISYDSFLCAAKYVFDYGLTGGEYITFESRFGVFTVDCIDSTNFRIVLGEPENEDGSLLTDHQDSDFSRQIIIAGKSTTYTPVTLGETGIALFFSNKQKNDKKEITDYFHHLNPDNRYRTVFVNIYNEEEISVETYSQFYKRDNCFISAVAGVASVINGVCDRELTINYRADTLFFQWDRDDNLVYITGRPAYVFSGTYYFDDEE